MSQKKSNRNEEKGRLDSYILLVKIKDHTTWRVVGSHRKKEMIVKLLSNAGNNITDVKFHVFDGLTGEIKQTFNSLKEFTTV